MKCLEVSGAVRPIYGSLGVKRLTGVCTIFHRVGNSRFVIFWWLTSRRYFTSSYQMSLLLLADPGTRRSRTAEPWVVGPSSYSLDLVERIILILELRYELWGQGILTENFPCRRSVSNCWTLVCWAVVLSTRPPSSSWENNFGTSVELWSRILTDKSMNCEVKES